MTTKAKSQTFSPDRIHRLCEKHKLGPITNIRYSASGKVNPILFLDDRYVLKVNVRDPDIPKLQREVRCMQLLTEKQLPVPEVIALDREKDILGYDCLIMTKLPGREIYSNWDNIPSEEREAICWEAGELLAQMHEISCETFGELAEGKQTFETWQGYVLSRLDKAIQDCLKHYLFSQDLLDQARNLYDQTDSPLLHITTPYLVHDDFHLGNLLYQNGQITGILDFEWACAGDPESEFRDPFTHEAGWQYVLDGYLSKRSFSAQFADKNRLYQLLSALQLSVVAHLHWSKQAAAESVHKVKRLVEG